MIRHYSEILKFWFEDLEPQDWYKKNLELDEKITRQFLPLYRAASAGELFQWRVKPLGSLAEIIVLDQFSRNMFRGQPQAFAADSLALALSQEAVSKKQDSGLEARYKQFLYMPYMHSESLIIHEEAMKLFDQPGLEAILEFEIKHKKIIEEFGRYPHRNEILGRVSTQEELEFLKTPGSSF